MQTLNPLMSSINQSIECFKLSFHILCVSLQIYHACDGPGLSILCFMRYDILEYFSVYGTALSMWVTLIGESDAMTTAFFFSLRLTFHFSDCFLDS